MIKYIVFLQKIKLQKNWTHIYYMKNNFLNLGYLKRKFFYWSLSCYVPSLGYIGLTKLFQLYANFFIYLDAIGVGHISEIRKEQYIEVSVINFE